MKSDDKTASLKITASHPDELYRDVCEEITDRDREIYREITSTALTEEQRDLITKPTAIHPREECVLAIHWHPEQVPMELIHQRIDRSYPNKRDELIIPTQHKHDPVLQRVQWSGGGLLFP